MVPTCGKRRGRYGGEQRGEDGVSGNNRGERWREGERHTFMHIYEAVLVFESANIDL